MRVSMFAITVMPGSEFKAAETINSHMETEAAFVPRAEVREAGNGSVACSVRPMVAGLVLLRANSLAAARKACRRAAGLDDVREPNTKIIELSPEEAQLLCALSDGSHAAPFSEGTMRGGKLRIECGQLANRESMVGRVSNRRKRAWVPVTLGGKPVELELGLRLTGAHEGGERR